MSASFCTSLLHTNTHQIHLHAESRENIPMSFVDLAFWTTICDEDISTPKYMDTYCSQSAAYQQGFPTVKNTYMGINEIWVVH